MISIAQHLKDRHLDVDNYSVHIDERERVATFMLFDMSGAICGYQQYRPDADKQAKNNPREGRYYTYRAPFRMSVFGMETVNRPGPLFLSEGIFDITRIHNLGLAGIATLSNDPLHIRGWLKALARHKVAICDPGRSGQPLAEHGDEALYCPEVDMGAMTDDQVQELVKRYIKVK